MLHDCNKVLQSKTKSSRFCFSREPPPIFNTKELIPLKWGADNGNNPYVVHSAVNCIKHPKSLSETFPLTEIRLSINLSVTLMNNDTYVTEWIMWLRPPPAQLTLYQPLVLRVFNGIMGRSLLALNFRELSVRKSSIITVSGPVVVL